MAHRGLAVGEGKRARARIRGGVCTGDGLLLFGGEERGAAGGGGGARPRQRGRAQASGLATLERPAKSCGRCEVNASSQRHVQVQW